MFHNGRKRVTVRHEVSLSHNITEKREEDEEDDGKREERNGSRRHL